MVDSDFSYRTPVQEELIYLADHLRPEDVRELVCMTGPDIRAEVLRCGSNSDKCYACYYKGVIIAAFGVIPYNPIARWGIIWMLATPEAGKHKLYTGKWTRRGVRAFLEDWEYLFNYVDAGNDETIKWLKWLGAKVHEPKPYGLYGNMYHLFEFRRD